jgi:hypothetical protein
VSWAGEEESANGLDAAREFSERCHHQEQIRIAVKKPGITTREFYVPVPDCFLRALPYSSRDISAQSGSLARFNVSRDCGGSWYLLQDGGVWTRSSSPVGETISEVTIPREIAWRIFTKAITFEEFRSRVQAAGDEAVGLHIVKLISIVGYVAQASAFGGSILQGSNPSGRSLRDSSRLT